MAGSGRARPAPGHSPAGPPADLAIDPADTERLDSLAAHYVEVIASADTRSPQFRQTQAAIDRLGEREFVATAAVSARVLERGLTRVRADLRAGSPLARRLVELRKEADRLDPRTLAPGDREPEAEARELDRYLETFSRSQPRLEEILAALSQCRFALEQDVAAISAEQATLSAEIDRLSQFAYLAERLDQRLTGRPAPGAEAGVAREDAGASRDAVSAQDVLFAVRRRRGEILTQLAVALQGLAALQLVEASNREIIDAVATAISTTASALRTAVIVAQAVAGQRLALVRLEATRQAAAALSESAAALESGIQASGGRAEALQAAWDEVRAALDRVERRKTHVMAAIESASREIAPRGPGAQ